MCAMHHSYQFFYISPKHVELSLGLTMTIIDKSLKMKVVSWNLRQKQATLCMEARQTLYMYVRLESVIITC